jgi:hypothetical protein
MQVEHLVECPLTGQLGVVHRLFQLIILLDDFQAAKLYCALETTRGKGHERKKLRRNQKQKEKTSIQKVIKTK